MLRTNICLSTHEFENNVRIDAFLICLGNVFPMIKWTGKKVSDKQINKCAYDTRTVVPAVR
jgi:hypothetical protein